MQRQEYFDDEDDEFYGEEEDGIEMENYGDELYYDEEVDDGYYYDEEDDNEDEFEEDNAEPIAAPVSQEMLISVEISDLKRMNDIVDVPVEPKDG